MKPLVIALAFCLGMLAVGGRGVTGTGTRIEIINSFNNKKPVGPCEPYAEKCRHCTDCSQCKHCAGLGGKCSVCFKK